jgi:hypothetical protein
MQCSENTFIIDSGYLCAKYWVSVTETYTIFICQRLEHNTASVIISVVNLKICILFTTFVLHCATKLNESNEGTHKVVNI